MKNPFTSLFSKKRALVISKNSPGVLAGEIYEIYKSKKKTMLKASELDISQSIFSEIYTVESPSYSLSEKNKSSIEDIRHVIYAIMNMEYEGGRDIDKLSEMYVEAINKLSILNYQPAVAEMKLLFRIMDKATLNDVDPIWAASYAVKSRLHYSPDYEDVIEEMFKPHTTN